MSRRMLAFVVLIASCAGAGPAQAPPSPEPTPLPDPTPSPDQAEPAPVAVDLAAESEQDLQFLKDLIETRSYALGRPVGATPLPDGSAVLFLRAVGPRTGLLGLYAFDVATGQTRELITPAQILKGGEEKLGKEEKARRERMRVKLGGFTGFQVSGDGKAVLVGLSGRIFVVLLANAASPVVSEVAGPDAAGSAPFDQQFSPDGKTVSFVRGGELWAAPAAGGKARQITRGATEDVLHAQAEFVAQEEMDRFTGYWWSPDAKQLVYEVADNSKVEKLRIADPADPAGGGGGLTAYPRPGHANADVTLGVTAAKGGGKTTWIAWDRQKYPYLGRVSWADKSPLTLIVQSRDHTELSLLVADLKTGKTTEILHEHDDAWVNLDNEYRWLPDGSGFLWSTERDGAWQLELRAPDGKLVRTLTDKAFGFRGVSRVDMSKGELVVTAGAEPVDQQLFRLPLGGGEPVAMTPADVVSSAAFARDAGVYVLLQASATAYHPITVHRADGTLIGELPSVAERPPALPRVEIAKVGGLWTSIVRPRDFDPKKKYPVLVDVYGGPHVTVVHRAAGGYVRDQWIADHGFLVVSIDGKGTPGRGREWQRVVKGKFADVPLDGQVAGLLALAAREPAMDLARVGISGASFGGYLAALAVMRRPDIFAAAVAASTVSDWLDYDTYYTEKYLGVPDLADTRSYDQNGLLVYAKDLTRPLLLIHGTADDNVLFSHTLDLADALFRAGKDFDLLPLAGQTHQPHEPDLLLRYYQRVFKFLRTHL